MLQVQRGISYPSVTLAEAIVKLKGTYNQVGKGPSSKQAYIKGLGYKGLSGASARTFAALLHYGLLEKANQGYKISSIGMEILYPKPDQDPKSAIKTAALTPRLFKDIYSKFSGDRLPSMLANTLIHDFKVYEKSAPEVAQNFRATIEYAGLLDDNQLLIRTESPPLENQITLNELDINEPQNQLTKESTLSLVPRALPSGIVVNFPQKLDYHVTLGRFSQGIQLLEETAQEIYQTFSNEVGDTRGQSDEENRPPQI